MLQVFNIGNDFEPRSVDGSLLRTRAHDNVYGAYTYEYKIEQGMLLLSVMNRKLHEVTYICPSLLPWVRKKRNEFLMSSYGNGSRWRQVSKGPAGSLFQSSDEQWFASWSKASNTTSFGTMIFYEEKYRLVT